MSPPPKRETPPNGPLDTSSDELLETYKFEELHGEHAIRLLKLRPAGHKTAEVECELIKEDLGELNTSYEALSWSWGGDDWDREVRIHHDGMAYHFPVPETLVAALKALRSSRRSRFLWIDTICIDQANPNEKNKQGQQS